MLKSNFFSAKNFNIFYNFGREKNPTSAIRSPIKPRKFPIKPRKFPIKHLENPRCFVLHPSYWAKKRGESLVFRALSSSLIQRKYIFPRNPNRVNIQQHFGNVKIAVFYLEFIMMAVSMKGQCTARCQQRVAQRKCWLIDNYFKEYKHLKTAEPHVASNVRYIVFSMKLT